MCAVAPLLPLLAVAGTVGSTIASGAMSGGGGGSTEAYQAKTATIDSQGMEQPMQTPSVALSDGKEDENAKKARRGRNVFRIDRTAPGGSGLGAGSGVNVPGV